MKKQINYDVKWFKRLLPCFAVGFDCGEFWLCLWFMEIEIWRSY